MKLKIFTLTFILTSFLYLPNSFAQNIPPGDQPGADASRFQAEMEEKQKELEKKKVKAPEIEIEEEKEEPVPAGPAFTLKEVVITGMTIFKAEDFKDACLPYIGKKVSFADLEKIADQIFKERDIQATDLRGDLLKYKRPLSFSLSSEVRYRVKSRHFPDGTGYNVVGYVEGSDPTLKNECFVIGGHFDHCGEHVGLLFPGANDNGSGSAVVMEMAEAFAKLRTKPKRSVVFALFGGEESGLKGSYYFVDNVPGPFTGVDAMFNFDMVGEGDGARCSYTSDPPNFKEIFDKSNERVSILRTKRELRGPGGGSDYAPFYQKGITCATFSSNGPHLFYHQSGDTIYRLNPDIMADIARLAFLAAYQWADR